MILQALKEYYDRMVADPDSGIAPLGWEWKEIPYVIVLNEDGSVAQIEDTQEIVNKKKRAKLFLVPQAVKRSVNIAANLLWDNVEYVSGTICKQENDKSKQEKQESKVKERHNDFRRRLNDFSTSAPIEIIQKFLSRPNKSEELKEHPAWMSAIDNCAFVTFKLVGESEIVARMPFVIDELNKYFANQLDGRLKSTCLISGEQDVIALTHPALKGVSGCNTSGGNIVSFNIKAAESFSKEQGKNAPIGEHSAFAYTTALNTLLRKESRQKIFIGDASVVFWSEKKTTLEDSFLDLFGEPEKDNPNKNTALVAQLLSSIETGVYSPEADKTKFYILGLSPNAARISIRFWHVGTVAEMETRFANWFKDLQIVHGPKEKEHLSLWRLLISTAMEEKTDKINPNLAGAVMRAILGGLPLPDTLRNAVLTRIKAECEVSYPRAKLLKAYLNRLTTERKFTVSLDLECQRIGYCLGRLFATLEKIQEEANPGLNATIRDRFYASASSAPVTVFANLVRLSNHHRGKLSNRRKIYFEKLLGEIIAKYDKFPAHLSLNEQAEFAIGYYHQRQDFFTKKNEEDNVETSDND